MKADLVLVISPETSLMKQLGKVLGILSLMQVKTRKYEKF